MSTCLYTNGNNSSSRDSGKAYVAIGDLSKDEGAKEVVRESQRLVGDIDILINNAAVYVNRGWADATPDQWADYIILM